ncbi:MAG TPA: response regulator transcription factor [Microthrixaceae bacterium]|nr:response regulator transcription factor [Microthrixaceae bacterium]
MPVDPSTPPRLLVVEDDEQLSVNLVRALGNAGYLCERAASAADARSAPTRPDLVLLDLGLPDGDGLDLLRELLERWPGCPVIVLTARAEEMDIVIGLDAGAVDYVPKPFRLAELLARIRAQLRSAERDLDPALDGHLSDGHLTVDLAGHRVWLDGAEIQLRAKEFDLLVTLLRRRGTVVTREELMSEVWDEHWFGSTKTLDVHIAALRRKLGEQAADESRITTLRGVGYRWEADG